MNTLRLYQCSLCKLKRELLINQDSPDLVNCIMTKNCRGKLTLLSQRKGSRPKHYDVSIFRDYETRAAAIPNASMVPIVLPVNIESGISILSAALIKKTVDPTTGSNLFSVPTLDGFTVFETQAIKSQPEKAIIFEFIELAPLSTNERHYSFTTNSIELTGEDNSVNRYVLRVDPLVDTTSILVDGILLTDDNYTVTLDRITFNKTLASSLIEVTILKNLILTIDHIVSIKFNALAKMASVRQSIAWGEHASVMIDQSTYQCMYCLDLSVFKLIKTYKLKRAYVEDTSTELDLTRAFLLLANKPYAFGDRRYDVCIKFTALTEQSNSISLQLDVDGQHTLKTSFNALSNSKIVCTSMDVASVTDNNISATTVVLKAIDKFIIGPQ